MHSFAAISLLLILGSAAFQPASANNPQIATAHEVDAQKPNLPTAPFFTGDIQRFQKEKKRFLSDLRKGFRFLQEYGLLRKVMEDHGKELGRAISRIVQQSKTKKDQIEAIEREIRGPNRDILIRAVALYGFRGKWEILFRPSQSYVSAMKYLTRSMAKNLHGASPGSQNDPSKQIVFFTTSFAEAIFSTSAFAGWSEPKLLDACFHALNGTTP